MYKMLSWAAVYLLVSPSVYAQSAGDFTFIAFNADGDDDFAIVALLDLPATTFTFTESVWNGINFNDDGNDYFVWSTDSVIDQGTVVVFNDVDASSSRTSSLGSIISSTGSFNLNVGGDAIWAMHISGSDTTFISAITNDADEFDGDIGTVSGTGLTIGSTAVDFSKGFASPDGGIYTGTRLSESYSDFLTLIGNDAYWTIDNSDGTQFLPFLDADFSLSSSVNIEGNAGWRLLSFPITNGAVEDISDDTPIQGITGGIDETAAANFLLFDDSGDFSEEPDNETTAFGDGKGFALYFFDNTVNGSSELPVLLETSGSEPSGDVDVALNSGEPGRFTLVGNPFATNFNTGLITGVGGNISDNISFWNNSTGSYISKDRTTNGGYIVSPWQGFWVETADSGVSQITFPTTGKTNDGFSESYFSKTVSLRGDIRFTLSSDHSFDEALKITFREHATYGHDRADATKLTPLTGAYAIIGFYSDEILKSVESLPTIIEHEIKLELLTQIVGIGGEFTFSWEGLESIPDDWTLTFHDYKTGQTLDMRRHNSYVFTSQGNSQGKSPPQTIVSSPGAIRLKSENIPRFGITIYPLVTTNERTESVRKISLGQNYPNPFNPTTTINYSVAQAGHVSITVYNLMGQKVAELINENKVEGEYKVTWNAAGVSNGLYLYRLVTGSKSITRKMTLIK